MPEASIAGTLDVNSDCIFLRQDLTPMVVVWPDGTTFDAAEGEVLFESGSSAMLGEELRASGAGIPLNEIADDVAGRVQECVKSTGAKQLVGFIYQLSDS